MALPASWTEASLVAALEREVEAVLSPLGLDVNDLLVTAAGEDTPALLGVSSVDDVAYDGVADVIKVRVIAQWMAWQRAYELVLLNVDLTSGDGSSIKDSQTYAHLRERLALAEMMARRYDEVRDWLDASAGGTAYVAGIGTAGSPYAWSSTPEYG